MSATSPALARPSRRTTTSWPSRPRTSSRSSTSGLPLLLSSQVERPRSGVAVFGPNAVVEEDHSVSEATLVDQLEVWYRAALIGRARVDETRDTGTAPRRRGRR